MATTSTPQPALPSYVFTERLGSGSYATVYKAYCKGAKRQTVAVKCVVRQHLSQPAADNLVHEISLLKRLKHRFIVDMKDFRWDTNYIYIITEYCGGGDLSQLIRSQRRLSEGTCRTFLRQLACALQYLRSQDVAHLDLKPQNLLLTSNVKPTLKVADFGFAKYLNDKAKETTLRGSPLYMAPEIVLQRNYNATADLWSVGVILYECLFGAAPYSSRTTQELLEKIKRKKPVQIPAGAHISADCRDLLLSLLKIDPSERLSFDDFFSHPFLDLEHFPSELNVEKGQAALAIAVKLDQDGEHAKALKEYCGALQYLLPVVQDAEFHSYHAALKPRVDEYIARAEALKRLLHDSPSRENDIHHSANELDTLSRATPALQSVLEIGHAAEQYEIDGQLALSLEKYETALSKLLPLLSKEPAGRRRDLVHRQVQHWLSQAENVKALLSIQEAQTANDPGTESSCCIS